MRIRKYWDDQPLILIMALAILFRLLAAIFAKGWGMFDDHYIVIESAQSWVDGHDYNNWLPGSQGNTGPTGHNLFYPGFNFLFFSLMKLIHIHDPQVKMLFMRLLLAAWSLVIVFYGYKITETLDGKKSARLAGILLALFWFMPWLSVRNLVEMVCVPFIILGFWFIIKPESKKKPVLSWFISGLFLGLATDIRLQAVFFPLGLGIWLLFTGKFKYLLSFTAGSILTFSLVQGGIDLVIWGKPFIEIYSYTALCFNERNDYISLPWYDFFLVIGGMLIPPVSIFLFWGFIRKWEKLFFIIFPILLFFVFHSWVPNKQERFIIPMIPLLIMIGSIGWMEFRERSVYWSRHKTFLRSCWITFWVLNSIMLLVFTFTYSKKSMAESMGYLSKYPDIQYMTSIDDGNNPEMFPKYYLGQWPVMSNEKNGDRSLDSILVYSLKRGNADAPRFVLFTGDRDIAPMVVKARQYLPLLVYETTIKPGFIDRLVHWLNPINRNKTVYIYRNAGFFPEKKQ
ncbi:MAG: glycosyltransferase family 39 protein [Bacteroidetes bacterium]|nr:glycosyltransferase family 39 protein [Bacteroidota bacterium]